MRLKTLLVRFAAVGVVNTMIDFGIFVALVTVGTPVVIANMVSTSAGLAFSFFANRRFAFRASTTGRQTLQFFAATAIGLWILQPLVITVVTPLLAVLVDHTIAAAIAKVAAIGLTAVGNFLFYSRVVFRDTTSVTPTQLVAPPAG